MAQHKFLKHIHEEHQEVKSIFKKLVKASESDRQQWLNELRENLVPHMEAEEKILYPALLKQGGEVKEDTLEGIEEHKAAEHVLQQLLKLKTSDETFQAKAKVLMEMVQHHIQEEEKEIFDDIEDSFSSQELDAMFSRFEKEEQGLKQKAKAA